MKKEKTKVLLYVLVLCVIASILPITPVFAAGTTVNTAEELVAAAANGGEITLGANITVEDTNGVEFTKNTTLNLNGYNITAAGDALVITAGMLTINGNGTVTAGSDGSYCAIWGNGGNVVVNGGTYVGSADADGVGNDTVYAKNNSVITINGGTFSAKENTESFAKPQYSCLNEKDGNGTIIVTAGTFVKFNPSDNYSENPRKNFVANGSVVVQEGENYVVHVHTLKTVEAKEATCTEAGNIAYYTCDVCEEIYSDAEGTTEVQSVVVDKKAHDLKVVEEKGATETEAGNIEYYTCSVCEKMFFDKEGTVEITNPNAVVIPATIEVVDGQATVSKAAVSDAIISAGESKDVVLALGKVNETVTSVELTVVSLEEVASENKTLTVETSEARVTLDEKALESIIDKAGNNESVIIEIVEIKEETLSEKQKEAIKEKEVAAVISATIISDGINFSDFGGGKVTVYIPFKLEEGTEAKDYKLLYVADDGSIEEVATKYEGGCLVAELEHFSEYVVVKEVANAEGPTGAVEGEREPESSNPNIPDTGDNIAISMVIASISLTVIAAIVVLKRKIRK